MRILADHIKSVRSRVPWGEVHGRVERLAVTRLLGDKSWLSGTLFGSEACVAGGLRIHWHRDHGFIIGFGEFDGRAVNLLALVSGRKCNAVPFRVVVVVNVSRRWVLCGEWDVCVCVCV